MPFAPTVTEQDITPFSSADSETRCGPSGYPLRYRVIEEPDGFHVEGRGRSPVYVKLSPARTAFCIVTCPEDIGDYDELTGRYDTLRGHCSLYAYHHFLHTIARLVMREWRCPVEGKESLGLQPWMLEKTQRALHYSGVYQQWQRLLALVPDQKKAVARAVFAATFASSEAGFETYPTLYEHAFLVQDIIRFRAAAIACHNGLSLVSKLGERIGNEGDTMRHTEHSSRLLAFHQRETALFRFDQTSLTYHCRRRALDEEALRLLACDWKALFTHSGKTGGSIRRTLMQLPGGVPGKLVCQLPWVETFLVRPLTDRLELLLFLLLAQNRHTFYGSSTKQVREKMGTFLALTSRKDILTALHVLSHHTHQELLPRKDGLETLYQYISDYMGASSSEDKAAHAGKLPSLVEKSISWHQRQRKETLERYLGNTDAASPTALPPIPVPANARVHFLDTVGAVVTEGVNMDHCIAYLGESAQKGGAFLFHVEHKNSSASVQVDASGQVVQSYGPHNHTNAASLYGRQLLARWGKGFPQHSETLGPLDVHPF